MFRRSTYWRYQEKDELKPSFKNIEILKDKLIGQGAFGAVREAKCDELICAVKILQPTLFDPSGQLQVLPSSASELPLEEHMKVLELMITLRHPNVVQYLGIHKDQIGLPALLMELMNDYLTHYLESAKEPIPYHTQVNICHDITLALSFLHSNDIVHRNISSNNILLTKCLRAKVSDFGMARLGDIHQQVHRMSDVYMPPEALQEKPEYTYKVDCFSLGVIIIQILTRKRPNPSNRHKHVTAESGVKGILIIPESERRQDHIKEVDDVVPLRPLALKCLKDNGAERPTAKLICEELKILKMRKDFVESQRQENELIEDLRKQISKLDKRVEKLIKKIPEEEISSR